jgi:hypothetical protein
MQPTIPNTRDFEVPIDGIGLTCVALNVTHISNALIGIE